LLGSPCLSVHSLKLFTHLGHIVCGSEMSMYFIKSYYIREQENYEQYKIGRNIAEAGYIESHGAMNATLNH